MPFDRSIRTFLLTAFTFSWAVGAGLFALGGIRSPVLHTVGGFAFMLGPAIAALVATRGMSWGERGQLFGLRPRIDRWLLAAWLVPVGALVLATLGSALVPGVTLRTPVEGLREQLVALAPPEKLAELDAMPPLALNALLLFQALIAGPLLNTPFMLSEELGWRGYLWARWRPLGFWRQSLATGLVWGVWHAPMILMGHNYPDAPVLGVLLMTIFCLLLAPLLQLVREQGGSIWHACLFHGALNAGASLGTLCLVSPDWMGRGIVGLPGFAVLGVLVAGVAVARHGSTVADPAP